MNKLANIVLFIQILDPKNFLCTLFYKIYRKPFQEARNLSIIRHGIDYTKLILFKALEEDTLAAMRRFSYDRNNRTSLLLNLDC